MTPPWRWGVAVIVVAIAATAPTAARADLLPPPGPWPAPVVGATNPLAGTPFVYNGGYATQNAAARVWLAVGGSRRTSMTRPVGARTVVRGRLVNRDNLRGISGAAVQLAAQPITGGEWFLVDVARTNSTGRFRAVLPAGPTCRVAALYWPAATSATPVYSRRLVVRARARVYLKTSLLRGHRIVYRGRVSGAPIPDGGLVVAAQVRNGPVWATVKLVRTFASGRFVARYRFKYGGRRFHVRALVPAQPAWPLYSGRSLTQRVTSR